MHVVDAWAGFPAYEFRVPVDLQQVVLSIQEAVTADLQALAASCPAEIGEVATYCRVGVPAQEIVKLATEESVNLIIMGTHGWTGIKNLFLGSVAENVLRTAACSVLVVRSSDSDREYSTYAQER